jgi:hypothetical protein
LTFTPELTASDAAVWRSHEAPPVEGGAEVPPAPWFDDIEQW